MLWQGLLGMIFMQQVLILPVGGHEFQEVIPPAPDTAATCEHPDLIIGNIEVYGNKVTRLNIILREVTLKSGDTVSFKEFPKLLEKTRQNLLNTSLFNFVTVQRIPDVKGKMNISIDVEERWYTWPGPIFELADRNFNTWWKDRDWERVNYGFFLYRDNFRGRKERVTFIFKTGYTQQFGIAYSIPYLDKKQKLGMAFSTSWSRNHEVNYGSVDNHQLFYKDEDHYVRKEFAARANVAYRPGIYNTWTAEVKYYDGNVADTIPSLQNDYYAGDHSTMRYFTFLLYFRHDKRDNKSYPLKGRFFDLEAGQNGIGILPGEEISQTYAISSIRKYIRLSTRWYAAGALKLKYSEGKNVPYFLTRGLGYRDFIRGYEYYVMDGQAYGVAKSGVKFCLVKPKVKKLKFLPMEKFNKFHYAIYLEAYGDAGYVSDEQYGANNPLTNDWQFGYGAGIHYVTYYDMVLRLEYSRNKLNEGGLFLHFSAPL